MPKELVHPFPLNDDDLKEISKSLSAPLPPRDSITPSSIASLTVQEMKLIVKYINTYKVDATRALKMTGKKQELRLRLEKYLWPEQRQGTFPLREERLFSVSKTPSFAKRTLTYTDSMNRIKIEKDLTLEGRQDPYYVIDKLLDIAYITNQTGKLEMNVSFTPSDMEKVSTSLYNVHLYWLTSNLHPQNWQDATITWNDSKLSLPRANRKLKKKLKKQTLITSTPLIIPKHVIRHQNSLYVLHPNFTQVEGNLIVVLVRNCMTKDLVLKVKDRTEKWKKEQAMISQDTDGSAITPMMDITGTYFESKPESRPTIQSQLSAIPPPIPNREEYALPYKTYIAQSGLNVAAEDADLIMSEDEIITLNDALSLERIEIACRGKSCRHKTCFDLTSYLEYSHSSFVWNCPVCDKPLRYEDLIIDENIERIISEVDPEIDKVKLHGDGTYTILQPEGVMQIPHHDEKRNDDEIMEDVSEDSEATVSQEAPTQNKEATSGDTEPVRDVVDIELEEDVPTRLIPPPKQMRNSDQELTKLFEAISDEDFASASPSLPQNMIIPVIDEESNVSLDDRILLNPDEKQSEANPANPQQSFRERFAKKVFKPNIRPTKSIQRFFQRSGSVPEAGNSERNPIEID